MNGIVVAVYASFVLAIGETSLKKSFRDFEVSVGFFFNAIFGFVILIPVALVLGASFSHFLQVLPYALAAAVLSEAFYYYALSKGQLSITAILLSTYPIYTIFFSRIINHEVLTGLQWPFILLAIVGTLMSSLPSKLSWDEIKKSGALTWPLLAAAAAGFSDTLAKSVINKTSAWDFLLGIAVAQIPVALIYLKLEKQKLGPAYRDLVKNTQDYFHAIVGGLLAIVGTALLWISFNYVEASIAAPVVATSGAITVLFATLFMDERMSWKNAFGILFIFIGVMGLSRVVGG